MARREYGEGSIYFDEKDQRWRATIEAGFTAKGTRRRLKVSGRTKAEVRTKLKEKKRQIAAEGAPAAGATRATVKQWAETWLDVTQHRIRPKSWASNRSAVRQWIVPTIGHKRLEALTPADVRAVQAAALRAGRAPSTVTRNHAVLHKMLSDAIVEGHQVPQRVLLIEGPGQDESDREDIPLPDALQLLDAASSDPTGARWVAALLQGMRQGECLGLTWDRIDFERQRADISWQLQPLPYAHGCDEPCGGKRGFDCPDRRFRVPTGYIAKQLVGAIHLVRPKSKKGTRIIPLVPWMVAALEQWRDAAGPSPHGLVWPRADGQPQTSEKDRRAWYDLQDVAQVARVDDTEGRRYLLHEARHTTSTLLMEAGVAESVIIAILGHARMVRSYQHVRDDAARRAMEQVAERLGLTA